MANLQRLITPVDPQPQGPNCVSSFRQDFQLIPMQLKTADNHLNLAPLGSTARWLEKL